MHQGLYDADYLPAYNNGVPTDTSLIWMGFTAYFNNGWVNHFYDPDSGLNYVGGSSPTALTEANRHWQLSRQGNLANNCYELGLSMHYMTDVTQPMHAANFTSSDAPVFLHGDYETFAMSLSVSEPAWMDVGGQPSDILIAAAHNAKSQMGPIWSSLFPCTELPVEVQACVNSTASALAPVTTAALQSAAQYAANYILQWLTMPHTFDQTVSAGTSALPNNPTWSVGCQPGEAIVGIYGDTWNSLLDIGVMCSAQNADGSWSAWYGTATAGVGPSPPGTDSPFQAPCPAGQAVSSIQLGLPQGSVGLAGIGITCTNPDDSSQTWTSPQFGAPFNGVSVAQCPPGEAFKGQLVINSNGTVSPMPSLLTGTCGATRHPAAIPTSPFSGQLVSLTSSARSLSLGVRPDGTLGGVLANDTEARWMVDDDGNGFFFLVNANGMRLSSANDGTLSLTANRGATELWAIDPASSGTFAIRSLGSGLRLSARPDGTFATTTDSEATEQWTLPIATVIGKDLEIHSTYGAQVVVAADGSVSTGVSATEAGVWTVEAVPGGGGTVFLVGANGVALASRSDGSVYTTLNRSQADPWVIVQRPGGVFTITSTTQSSLLSAQANGALSTSSGYVGQQQQWTLRASPLAHGPNLALGKPTSQSSTYQGSLASAASSSAVDGNTDGNFQEGSVTATGDDVDAWWQVDLGSVQDVDSVVVWNRTECCGDRLSNFYVLISDDGTTFSPAAPSAPGWYAGVAPARLELTINQPARYVRVMLSGQNVLSLAEVQVFAPRNLALGRAASQSSTYVGSLPSAAAASAVDGNTDGNFQDGSVTATGDDVNAWWQVDLGSVQNVETVVLWNRTDCCGDRLGHPSVLFSADGINWTDAANLDQTNPLRQVATGFPGPARYVMVQLNGQNVLSLAEVQVFGRRDMALGKATSQSSTYTGSSVSAASSNAVDGNTDGNFQDGSVTATNDDVNAWWQVDLQAVQPVQLIMLWNRTDCCSSRLSNYSVLTSTDGVNWSTLSYSPQQVGASTALVLAGVTPARYVKVQLNGQNFLSLAEVQVF